MEGDVLIEPKLNRCEEGEPGSSVGGGPIYVKEDRREDALPPLVGADSCSGIPWLPYDLVGREEDCCPTDVPLLDGSR